MMSSFFAARDKNIIMNTISDLIRAELANAIKNLGFDNSKIYIDVDYEYIRVMIKMNGLNEEENIQLDKMLGESICS